jgi:hypothetical protein
MFVLAAPALASQVAVLEGRRCNRDGSGCVAFDIELFDNGRLLTSDGIAGTYTLTRGRTGRDLSYQVGRTNGTIAEAPENCWEEAESPLNPALGSINVCLTTELQRLRHYDPVCDTAPLWISYPQPQTGGDWYAGRLTPEQAGGMWVHEVTYYLNTDGGPNFPCEPVDHRVQVFVGDAASPPPADPVVLYEFDVNGATLDLGDTHNTLVLPDYVYVAADESLFVSLEQIWIDADTTSCHAICTVSGFLGDHSYWSQSPTAPYTWQDLNQFGTPDLMVSAGGIYAAP